MVLVGDLLPIAYSQATVQKLVFGSFACSAANQTECQSSRSAKYLSLGQSHCFNRTTKCFCAAEDTAEERTFCGMWEIHYSSGKQ